MGDHVGEPAAVSRRRVERVRIDGQTGPRCDPSADDLVVEAPLELRWAGRPQVVTMRTPGRDVELIHGLLFAEGVIDTGQSLPAVRAPDDLPGHARGDVLDIDLVAPTEVAPRTLLSSSSCGVCGKTALAELDRQLPVCRSDLRVTAACIAALPERVRGTQAVFARTGGLHAAAACDPSGQVVAVREDVGRHNAVDKLVGWALAARRVPCAELILCVSGRLSFEIVQKAAAAGFPVIVAVSAPSSLAVDLAERYRITLCGFTRDQRFNIYSHASRIKR
ncbi:MAG: formate dehydrogenase accessory sulfurtransferase FdhD [Myxococcota bacterium]